MHLDHVRDSGVIDWRTIYRGSETRTQERDLMKHICQRNGLTTLNLFALAMLRGQQTAFSVRDFLVYPCSNLTAIIAKKKRNMIWSGVDETRKSAIIAVCASILAARKLATVPRNSPAYVAAISDAVADAKKIVERIEHENITRSR